MPIEENKIQKHVDNFLASIANEAPLDGEIQSSTEYWLSQIATKLHAGDLTPETPQAPHLYLHHIRTYNKVSFTFQSVYFEINIYFRTVALLSTNDPINTRAKFIQAFNRNNPTNGILHCGVEYTQSHQGAGNGYNYMGFLPMGGIYVDSFTTTPTAYGIILINYEVGDEIHSLYPDPIRLTAVPIIDTLNPPQDQIYQIL